MRCACHATSSRGHGGANPRRSSFRKLCVLRLPRNKRTRPRRRQSAPQLLQELCVLRLPRNKQPRPWRRQSAPQLLHKALSTAPATQQAAATAAPIRAAAPSGGSLYCACHTTNSRGHGGANPRCSSFRRLSVLRLPCNK